MEKKNPLNILFILCYLLLKSGGENVNDCYKKSCFSMYTKIKLKEYWILNSNPFFFFPLTDVSLNHVMCET